MNDKGVKTILPVDYKNTGMVQHKTILSDGVHQFLQIKHNLVVTPENIVTSFVSNVGFFKRFRNGIYGLTGTLGDVDTQNSLEEIYQIQIGFIPTFKIKLLKELPLLFLSTEEEWKYTVAKS